MADRYAVKIPLPDKRSLGVEMMMAEGYLPGSDYVALTAASPGSIVTYLENLKRRLDDAIKEVRNA